MNTQGKVVSLVLIALISLSVLQAIFMLWGDTFTGKVVTLSPFGGTITLGERDQFAVNGFFVEVLSIGSQGITVSVDGEIELLSVGQLAVINGLEIQVTRIDSSLPSQQRVTLLVRDPHPVETRAPSFGGIFSLRYGDMMYLNKQQIKILPTDNSQVIRIFVGSDDVALHVGETARVNDLLLSLDHISDATGTEYDSATLVVRPASQLLQSEPWPRYELVYNDPLFVQGKELVFLGVGPSERAQFRVDGRYGSVKLYDEERLNGLTLSIEHAVNHDEELFDSVVVTVAPDLTVYSGGRA